MKLVKLFNKKTAGIMIFVLFAVPAITSAQLTISGPSTLRSDPLEDILGDVIVGILGLVGIIGIIYLVYGSIQYVMSAGDNSKTEEAKQIITYALWGLFLVAASYALVKMVIDFAG